MSESELIEAMKRARGKEFVRLFREADATVGEKMRESLLQTKRDAGKITITDVVKLAIEFDVPVKTTFRMVESPGVIPSGIYDIMLERGFKAREAIQIVKDKMAAD